MRSSIKNMNEYNEYYKKNDQDIKANDVKVLKLLNEYDKCLRLKNKDWQEDKNMLENILQELDINSEELYHIYNIIEVYTVYNKTKTPHKIEILIPPNTNRAHAHYLFKNIKDCDYKYQYKNRNNEIITFDLLGKNFKNKFYNFCYKNTIY
uniref:Uncharacterized protein n=1 Tax=Mimivirus LCMiAC02 TaxID=2506609 RepID=A0A4D5XF33_9VIRU|nr:MAG: hypothetical protein LCMiAC02_04540 [Mimivirus LCMiAC02]